MQLEKHILYIIPVSPLLSINVYVQHVFPSAELLCPCRFYIAIHISTFLHGFIYKLSLIFCLVCKLMVLVIQPFHMIITENLIYLNVSFAELLTLEILHQNTSMSVPVSREAIDVLITEKCKKT